MNGKKSVSSASSSVVVSVAAIIILFALSAVALKFSLRGLGVFLAAVGILGLVSRFWSLAAVKNLSVKVDSDRNAAEIGEKVVFSYSVENKKPLPVMWLEFCATATKCGCLEPDEGFTLGHFEETEAEKYGFADFFRKRLIFLMGFQILSWQTSWTAVHRGIYFQESYFLRSGDGFGLSESHCIVMGSGGTVAVWPKISEVTLEPFLRQAWLGQTGKKGYVEDITVLNGLRDYRPGDNWKRIDWRAAARQDEIKVKIFEKVLPERIHFLFDCASFIGRSPDNAEAEEAISLIASLLLALDTAGIPCGITLPETETSSQLDLQFEDGATIEAMLYELAAFCPASAKNLFETDAIAESLCHAGQIWIVSSDSASPACRQLCLAFDEGELKFLTDSKAQTEAFSVLLFDDVMRDVI